MEMRDFVGWRTNLQGVNDERRRKGCEKDKVDKPIIVNNPNEKSETVHLVENNMSFLNGGTDE